MKRRILWDVDGTMLRGGAALRGESYDPAEVWVIGDTEHDLACARASGVRCLLVGTSLDGCFHCELDADAYFDDLVDTEAAVDVLLGARED